MLVIVLPLQATAQELADGDYLITRETHYMHPVTGEVADGESSGNTVLGESMCDGIIEDEVLLETIGGRHFVSFGFSLASSISDVSFAVEEGDTFADVSVEKTGSSNSIKNEEETSDHYRIEVASLDDLIKCNMYVEPMGREVTFFMTLDASNAEEGTGYYLAEMRAIVQAEMDAEKENDSAENANDGTAYAADNGASGQTESSNVSPIYAVIIGAIVVVAVVAIVLVVRSRAEKAAKAN